MEEIVEIAAEAICNATGGPQWVDLKENGRQRETMRAEARAALEAVTPFIAAKALRDAVELMRRCKDPGHWNLRDPHDPETSYSPDVWLERCSERIEYTKEKKDA